jgi:hypothetical protein
VNIPTRRLGVTCVTGVALALAATACSSGPAHNAGAPTTTSAAASSTTAAPSAADQKTANSVVLSAADLPGSWASGAVTTNDESGDVQTDACLGIADSDDDETAYAGSPTLTQNMIQGTSKTDVYTPTAVVAEDLRGSTSPKVQSCLSQLFRSQIPSLSDFKYTRAPLPSAAGSLQGFNFTGSFVTGQGTSATEANIDQIGLTRGRIEVAIDIITQNTAIPAALVAAATGAIAKDLNALPAS